jgi:hypothetical protein
MVGCSINLLPLDSFYSCFFRNKFDFEPPYIHVQTTAYALSAEGLQLLAGKGFFDITKDLGRHEVISSYEILMSQILLSNGFSISSILPTYEEFSTSTRSLSYCGTSKEGDPQFKSAFYGRTLSPLEIVFVKTNRDVISTNELASYTFTALAGKEIVGFLTEDGFNLFQSASKKMLIN